MYVKAKSITMIKVWLCCSMCVCVLSNFLGLFSLPSQTIFSVCSILYSTQQLQRFLSQPGQMVTFQSIQWTFLGTVFEGCHNKLPRLCQKIRGIITSSVTTTSRRVHYVLPDDITSCRSHCNKILYAQRVSQAKAQPLQMDLNL